MRTLWFSAFNVDFAAENIRMPHIVDQILGHCFVFEHDKTESARLASVDVLENDGVLNLTKLREMLEHIVLRQFEVQTAHKNLRLWIFVGKRFPVKIFAVILLPDNHVRVGLVC